MELRNFSNPDIVYKRALEIFGTIQLKESTRKDKKYMIRGEFSNNKWVHFGQWGYKDFTYTFDPIKRLNFQKRNHKWKNSEKNKPSFLSYYLLW